MSEESKSTETIETTPDEEFSKSNSPNAGKFKLISPTERHFAILMLRSNLGAIEAARVAFGWRCEPGSAEAMKAQNIARSPRIKKFMGEIKQKQAKEEEAKISLKLDIGEINKENLRDFAFKYLEKIRDTNTNAANRFKAVQLLKKLHDPGKDINLVWSWIDICWRYQTAHCPCCHSDFPLTSLQNNTLVSWRERTGAPKPETCLPDRFSRRMELIKRADKRRLPHPGQIECLSVNERHIVGLGAARAGKLICSQTPILTTKGWKEYGELNYGDVLFDENGKPCNIIEFSREWTEDDGDWYELEFDNGERIRAHENHEWVTHQYNYRAALQRRHGTTRLNRRSLGPTVLETKQIVDTLFVRDDSHVNHAIPVTAPLQMPDQEFILDPYVLGVWLGDGCATNGMISGIDNEIFDEIGKYFKLTQRKIGVYPLGIKERLRTLNLLKNKHVPSQYLFGGYNQRLALLQGLMDSDGYCSLRGQCNFDNTNYYLILAVRQLCASLGIKTFITSKIAKLYGKSCSVTWRVSFTTTLPVFKLKRKLERLPNEIKSTHKYHYIVAARKISSQHGRCIEVDSPSHLYLAGTSLVPTHNSYLLALFAALGVLLPGVEIWILGETFERTDKEVDYLKKFLEAILYPHYRKLISITQDKKTKEAIITTRWGSEVRVKSAKAPGSITGHALEFALCAEPGWLSPDIYEELRARMSERLGRIIALGTPKGLGGFVGRLTHAAGRDETGRIKRWKPEERMLSNGCSWGLSMYITQLKPGDNPEYVKSELTSARMELSDSEYASEFEGLGVAEEGAKFGMVQPHHAQKMPTEFFEQAVYVLGVDQGPKNFGACLIAYDGNSIVPCWEFFNSDEKTTMKRNLVKLRARVPYWIKALGGEPENWKLTITDMDPPLIQIFYEMEEEGQPWRTELTVRHKNIAKLTDNWRRECQEFVNNVARRRELIFHTVDFPTDMVDDDESPGAYILHDQVMTTIDVPDDPERENRGQQLKGWQTSDPFRGDHCFHPDTDVLTAAGWKRVSDVLAGELVMSRTPEGRIVWVPVTNTIIKDYNGPLYSYGSKYDGASFMITPDHNLYVEDQGDNLQFVRCGDIVEGKASKFYKVPARSKVGVPGSGLLDYYGFDSGESFAYYLGFFLAEGCCNPDRPYVNVDQKSIEILEKIRNSRSFSKGSIFMNKDTKIYRLSFYDKELYSLLGHSLAYEKRIPRWFFDTASVSEHEQLFAGLMDGDGTWNQRKYDSTSEGLVDDFQELVSRLGVVSSKSQTADYRDCIMPSGRVSHCKPSYRIRYRRLDRRNSTLSLRKEKFKEIPYNGKVYCISVPPHSVIFTRYNGKTMWISQCLDAWYFAMWTIYTQQIVADKKLITAGKKDVWADQKAAFDYKLTIIEQQELNGYTKPKSGPDTTWEDYFGKSRKGTMYGSGYYPGES